MRALNDVTPGQQRRFLGISTLAFTLCFAVWTIFSIIGVQIKQDLGLNDTEFGLLVATPILTGSLSRIFLGIWTDQYGGRLVYTPLMVAAAGGDLAAVDGRDLSDVPARRPRRRARRRLVRRGLRLCVALVPQGAPGERVLLRVRTVSMTGVRRSANLRVGGSA